MAQTFTQSMLPRFKSIQAANIEADISTLLNKNKMKVAELLAQKGPYTWENLMQPLEEMNDGLQRFWSPIAHLHAVQETEALRQAYNKVLPLLTAYQTELSQNQALYQAIKSLGESSEFAQLSPAQQKIIENNLRDFRLSGIHLDEAKKARLAELEQQHSQLTTKFAENLLDSTNAFTLQIKDEKQLQGLPPEAKLLAQENAKRRNVDAYVFTLEFPSYSTAIKFLDDRALREALYRAYTTRASDQGPNAGKWDNTQVMEDILAVRHEIAQLVGFNHYADYSLATKMAHKTEDVLSFLHDLLARSKPIAEQEYQSLAALAREEGIDEVQAWDLPYYSEKQQEKLFQFTQEDLRPYFPLQKALDGLFSIVHKLYGITINEQPEIETWNEQARFFAISDEKNNLRGGFYIDLFARPHKRDGAWMDECIVRRMNKGQVQYPVTYLTCNFMPPVDGKPALLTHDDVLTLFHEFGHGLHHMLTLVDYAGVSGINGVAWDAVEFPSQFMENFCWERESLDLISGHYKTGQPLPDALYEKMLAAKHFQTGMQMMRQLEFALFDFRLHLEYDPKKKRQVQAMLDDVRKETNVYTPPAFNRFQHSFSHIFAGGYAAGYYSYKWAEVLSCDAYEKFQEDGIFNHHTGLSFMKNILEVGGMRDPMENFIAFRGREPQVDALLRLSGIS